MNARFRLAVAADSLSRWYNPQRTLEKIHELGVRDVQLCSTLFPSLIDFTEQEATDVAQWLRALELRGESISTFPYRVRAPRYVNFLERLVRFAPLLGLRIINTYLLPFNDTSKSQDDIISDYARALAPLLESAAAQNLVFTLEPECFDVSATAAGLKRIVAAVDHPNFKLTYDPCNLYQANEEAFPYAYEELAEHVAHVHLKNGSVFAEGRHPADEKAFAFVPPHADRCMRWGPMREGAINMSALLGRLVRDGYDGVVVLEPHTQTASKQLKFLRDEIAFVHEAVSSGNAASLPQSHRPRP